MEEKLSKDNNKPITNARSDKNRLMEGGNEKAKLIDMEVPKRKLLPPGNHLLWSTWKTLKTWQTETEGQRVMWKIKE